MGNGANWDLLKEGKNENSSTTTRKQRSSAIDFFFCFPNFEPGRMLINYCLSIHHIFNFRDDTQGFSTSTCINTVFILTVLIYCMSYRLGFYSHNAKETIEKVHGGIFFTKEHKKPFILFLCWYLINYFHLSLSLASMSCSCIKAIYFTPVWNNYKTVVF